MPSRDRYLQLKADGICTECACRPATQLTRCDRCHHRNRCAKVLKDVTDFSLDDLERLIRETNGICQICKRQKKLVLDHCHTLKHVRGLICNNCNRALGLFRDSIDALEDAAMYLKRFSDGEVAANRGSVDPQPRGGHSTGMSEQPSLDNF